MLSFLGSAYFDDVCTAKETPRSGAELVAVGDGKIVGVLDLSVAGVLATIDTIAAHPDYQRAGAGTKLLERALARAAELGAVTIDAWTRDDEPVLRWYRSRGFAESEHYLHVYADYYVSAAEPQAAVDARPGLKPVKLFLHAPLAMEPQMRQTFRRVHVCRRFSRPVTAG